MVLRITPFLLLLAVFLQMTPYSFAQSNEERLLEVQIQQKELADKIANARTSIKSLSGQIELMDNKIKLTFLQIQDTERKIGLTENDIDILSRKIVKVEDSMSLLQSTLLERIRASYAMGKPSAAQLYLSSTGFSDALITNRYLEYLQKNDLKLLARMQSTKANYGEQKSSLEVKQEQLETLQADLTKQQNLLAQQKKDKEVLLGATKNDEKRYQQLLAQLQSEQRAIESAIANSANLVNGVRVNKGDIIALMGNSGAPSCSTGAHLHFEVRENGSLRDPAQYLKSTNLGYDDEHTGRFNGSGSWDWPLADPIITQEYGMSYWARTGFYGGGPHTGIDMVNRSNYAIRAVVGGTLYKSTTRCGSSVLKYAVLDHGAGIRSYYLHIQ